MQIFKDNYTKWTRIFFAVMTIFAVIFANERFQADGAHYLLHVTQSESFRVEHQRFILIFSQGLSWLGVQLGLPLSSIIVLNAINPVVWWLVLFLYATYFLRDRHAGIGIILTHVLGVLHIQFTPMYEIWYGVPLIILLYSHLRNHRIAKPADLVFFFAILITVLFAHPLLPIPAAFLFVYYFIEQKKINWKIAIPVVLVVAGWYLSKKLMLTEYEAGKVSLLSADWNNSPKQLLHISYYGKLFSFFFTWYMIPLVLLVWVVIFFWLRKMWKQLLLTCAFFLGHILLINFTHENNPELTPYFERMYLPLIPIVLIPFLFTLCRELEFSRSFIMVSLLLIVGWRIGRFCDVGHDYKHRTALTTQLISQAEKQGGSKFILSQDDYHSCFSWVDWSYPMETLLRSSSTEPYKRITIVTHEDLEEDDNLEKLDEDEFLFRRWDIMKDKDLNPNYFTLSKGWYKELSPICK